MADPMAADPTAPSQEATPREAPHAFHQNLPWHHRDPATGEPYVTTFARHKARELYQLALSLRLTPEMLFPPNPGEAGDGAAGDGAAPEEEEEDDDEYADEPPPGEPLAMGEAAAAAGRPQPQALATFGKHCFRLQAQWSGLEQLKYGGWTQRELCQVVLHLLRLATAYVDPDARQLHFEDVGELVEVDGGSGERVTTGTVDSSDDPQEDGENEQASSTRKEELHADLERPFALPSPTREVLLLIIVNILSNKGPLRAASNTAVYVPGGADDKRLRLVFNWKAFLRILLRTAPYLDERKQAINRSDSNTRQSTVLKRTSQMIRDARHFFDQQDDATARHVWEMVRTDCMYNSHTNACYRGAILLYLFSPSQCSVDHYRRVLPEWIFCWTNIDRCPEYDFLWLAMFCRARKHVGLKDYDWGPIRRRLLTHAQYWLQLPIGGAAMDKSFPRAPNPRSRSCPSRLKALVGTNSSYEEGIDFVAKVVKLLVFGLGSNGSDVGEVTSSIPHISEGTQDVLRFLNFVTPYFNPSNVGSWTFTLGAFLHYFAYEMCCRFGATAGMDALRCTHPALIAAFEKSHPGASGPDIPPHEIAVLLDALLPLCQQAIYSKNAHVGRAGEAAMLYLVQIDPTRATPAFLDFAVRALDTTAITMSHQAPAALSALTGLIQPSLRSDPTVLLGRLPDILRLSLAGIDSNDQHKCIRTLILYRSLTSWIPLGGLLQEWELIDNRMDVDENIGLDGTRRVGHNLFLYTARKRESPEYRSAIESLPESSLLKQGASLQLRADAELKSLMLEEALSAMSDWALEFLERVFGLLRASGEREKTSKSSSGVASRHSSADVHQARNFSRVLTESLMQVFAAMHSDVHEMAVRAVQRFIEEETLSFAAKDASIVCQAASAARLGSNGDLSSPGLDALIHTLTNDFSQNSVKTTIYRVRCLAGAVKSAGLGVIKHRDAIFATINHALASSDRHLLKSGCKLLRHTLATLVESYPVSTDYRPRIYRNDESGSFIMGRSAQLRGDEVQWHVPDESCIRFFADLLNTHISRRLDDWCRADEKDKGLGRSRFFTSVDLSDLRRCLRIVRYMIRGGAGLLLDLELDGSNEEDIVPYERSAFQLLDLADADTKAFLLALRGRLCTFLTVLSSVIASDTLYPEAVAHFADDDPYRKSLMLTSADPKICKECCDVALLILTRRGAAFRSQEGRTIWKAQKQLATDFTLCAQVDSMVEILQMGNLFGDVSSITYKDGEDGGKTLSRRLLVTRMLIFHNSLQRNASFQVPRRMRRYEREQKRDRIVLFSAGKTLSDMLFHREQMFAQKCIQRPLDLYEGVIDGLFALCCHSNTHVRASAISVIDYAITRFGWILAPRVPRLLSGLLLQDKDCHGKFGVPSCVMLAEQINQQGKRKRLAEAVKGVCSILSLSRSVRHILSAWQLRLRFVQMICGTDHLLSLLPAEELQKIVHYLQGTFTPFRSSIYVLPSTYSADKENRIKSIRFVLDILAEKPADADLASVEDGEALESTRAHWRKLLFAAWFLLNFIENEDITAGCSLRERVWSTCFALLENNMGQPLQRVTLGIVGKLVSIMDPNSKILLTQQLTSDAFCKVLGRSLVYDHKEDSSVGGGHDSQWSAGVENIIRDASRHMAPKILFPFQRTSQSLAYFKVSHCQLIENLISSTNGFETSLEVSKDLLSVSKELAYSKPSEDQRNELVAAAEIFAGVCSSCIRISSDPGSLWSEILLPHLDDVMVKMPFSLCGAYFDALRYSLQFSSAATFAPVVAWLISKIKATIWQLKISGSDSGAEGAFISANNTSLQGPGTEGFTAQSKWLFLLSAILIEMDESHASDLHLGSSWYETSILLLKPERHDLQTDEHWMGLLTLISSDLLPILMEALGHPFDSCRDHISRCLFRVCYSHRMSMRSAINGPEGFESNEYSLHAQKLPTFSIVTKLLSLLKDDSMTFVDRCNAFSTTRRFISYCVHLGDAKFEYSNYVAPLLPLVFEALNLASDEEINESTTLDQEENAARRALEADVMKGYRFMISDMSITGVVSYGRNEDISKVLDAVESACEHSRWQVRHGAANFLRCFQDSHKFLFSPEQAKRITLFASGLLADERREVSSAGMAVLTGILAASSPKDVALMVKDYVRVADRARMPKARKGSPVVFTTESDISTEKNRLRNQQTAVFFLVAVVLSQPYDTPAYVPEALMAISKHSFERSAPLSVRDTVKRCCAEYKRTHMSDNWELHRSMFTQEQLEAFEDVISIPHYYA